MYRYELNIGNTMDLEMLASILSKFISSVLTAIKADSKFKDRKSVV